MNTLFQTEDARLQVIEDYDMREDIYQRLIDTLVLDVEPPIKIWGKECRQKRNVGFFSDTSVGYQFSNQVAAARPLTPELAVIMARVNTDLSTGFNGVLVNYYHDGTKYISAHSDSEKGLDTRDMSVASICYGPATRLFRIRDKKTKSIVHDHQHKPGSLLIMAGHGFQQKYTHEIPIQKLIKEPRLSLTFRVHNQ